MAAACVGFVAGASLRRVAVRTAAAMVQINTRSGLRKPSSAPTVRLPTMKAIEPSPLANG